MVHFPGADLHFERNSLFADDRRVERLVHVRLRRGNIILKPVRQRAEHIVDNAEDVIAVVHRVDNDADGVNVIDFIHRTPLNEHFAVNAVDALDAPFEINVRDCERNTLADALFRQLDEMLTLAGTQLQPVFDFPISNRVKDAQREILQLLLDGADAEPVRNRRINLHVFTGFVPLLLRRPRIRWCAYCEGGLPA